MSIPTHVRIMGIDYEVMKWETSDDTTTAVLRDPESFVSDPYLELAAHLCVEIWNGRGDVTPHSFLGTRTCRLPAMMTSDDWEMIKRVTGLDSRIHAGGLPDSLGALADILRQFHASRPVEELHRPRSYEVCVAVTRVSRKTESLSIEVKRVWSEVEAARRASKSAQSKEEKIDFSQSMEDDVEYEHEVEFIELSE